MPNGKFVWPGYGENMRVLSWILQRVEGKGGAKANAFGLSPSYEDLHWKGLDFSREQFASVIGVDKAAWQQELKLHDELFTTLAHHLPTEFKTVRARIEAELA